ncbi:MAG: DUF3793 family protein [Lachnospiraceae bacterium]|nr:DUF3793 family protein [Lachnospiraceae bacterium]
MDLQYSEYIKENDGKLNMKFAFQCAPVLFGVKPSNLLILEEQEVEKIRPIMLWAGTHFYRFLKQGKREIWFVYRPETMRYLLGSKDVKAFLKEYGYKESALIPVLKKAGARYKEYLARKEDFPHELGVLLGYPVADVRGFIDHEGQDYLYSGYWKVYENPESARRTFAIYEEAKKRMLLLLKEENAAWV